MSPYPNSLSIKEQLLQAERKFQELLKADVEFHQLKPVRLKVKELQEKLKKEQYALKESAHFTSIAEQGVKQ